MDYEQEQLQPARRVKRKKKRRKRAVLFYILMSAVAVTIFVVLSLTVFFKLTTFKIIGETKYTDHEIIEASGIKKGENLFLIRAKDAENRIEKKLTYIENADITIELPATLKIEVGQAEAAGAVFWNGEYLIISKKSKVLERVPAIEGRNLILIEGTKIKKGVVGEKIEYESEQTHKAYDMLMEGFNRMNCRDITRIDLSDYLSLTYTWNDQIDVNLGSWVELDYKIRFANELIENKIPKGQAGTIDVSGVATGNRKAIYKPK